MKWIVAPALAALSLFGAAGFAEAEAAPTKLFACSIGAKTVSVTLASGRLVYRFGTTDKEEMSIVGDPAAGNVFAMTQRFTGPEYQLRFKNGEFSYIVYSAEGDSNVGAASVAGLVVMRGAKRISDSACSRFAEVTLPDDALKVPEDTEAYSAM